VPVVVDPKSANPLAVIEALPLTVEGLLRDMLTELKFIRRLIEIDTGQEISLGDIE
jgi:hypothetical protein